jgi:hypothetical protein
MVPCVVASQLPVAGKHAARIHYALNLPEPVQLRSHLGGKIAVLFQRVAAADRFCRDNSVHFGGKLGRATALTVPEIPSPHIRGKRSMCYRASQNGEEAKRVAKRRWSETIEVQEGKVPSSSAQASYRAPSIWRLGGLAAPQLAREVAAEIRAKNFLGRASELAFDFLFALFPLIVFMLSLFGIFASRSVELQQDFLSYFSGPLPPLAFELLKKVTSDLANNASGGKLTLGILTALRFANRAHGSRFG